MSTSSRMGRTIGIALVAATVLLSAGEQRSSEPSQPSPVRASGQTATLLPDGRWLFVGGDGPAGPQPSMAVLDPATGAVSELAAQLSEGRTGHTATVLADGSVLIVGGRNAAGELIERIEQDSMLRASPSVR